MLAQAVRACTARPHRSILASLRISHRPLIHFTTNMASISAAQSLQDEVAQQKTLLRDLQNQKADAALLEEAKKKLGDLQRSFALLQNAMGGGSKKKERLLLKTPKVRTTSSCPRSALKLIQMLRS